MIDFDILQSYTPLSSKSQDCYLSISHQDQGIICSQFSLLTLRTLSLLSNQYYKLGAHTFRDISTKVKKDENIRQVINIYFNFKPRFWQVGAIIVITKHKGDVCTIANTKVGKSFIYQLIPVITRGFKLVILSIIALIEDQVCIVFKMLYIYHLHSIL